VEELVAVKNKLCENPNIRKNEGKYKYLSLARLYSGEIMCKKGIREIKKGKNKIRKKK
jgi:hypothetical protein